MSYSHLFKKIFTKYVNNLENIFFQENGPSWPNIHFSCGDWIVLGSFWSDLDSGTIQLYIRMWKFIFWAFKKSWCDTWHSLAWLFFEMPKNHIFPILMQLLMAPLSWAHQKSAQNNSTPPSKMNIEWATAICFKKIFFPNIVKNLENSVLGKQP